MALSPLGVDFCVTLRLKDSKSTSRDVSLGDTKESGEVNELVSGESVVEGRDVWPGDDSTECDAVLEGVAGNEVEGEKRTGDGIGDESQVCMLPAKVDVSNGSKREG